MVRTGMSSIIGDFRFLHSCLRTEGVFFGQQDRDTRMPIPEHISARPVDGMVAFDRPAARQLAPVP